MVLIFGMEALKVCVMFCVLYTINVMVAVAIPQLPEPLLTFGLYHEFLTFARVSGQRNRSSCEIPHAGQASS